ncbi:MAG: DNA topoisomerase IB [Pseudomonadota bacterium]|nr:DNA topoisomerase IB [Pseudomonadota bacterium]
MPATEAAQDAANSAGLVYVSDEMPGISRRRQGRGFSYRLPDGNQVRDDTTLVRIRALAIPPAYTEVWICRSARGHMQATGRDARRRKQYRYHPEWDAMRGDGKFERIVAFGEALPRLRRRLRSDLALPGYPRDKVLAIVVALMAETLVRVGNQSYARSNNSYGLTTLRDRHLQFAGTGRARLRFRGKGGQAHEVAIDDRRLVRLVRGCQQLPGQQLFQYRDDEGALQPVDSGLVNAYLRAAMGADFTAKDFRTWGGSLHAFRLFAATPLPAGETGAPPAERALATLQNTVVKEVAAILGNTIAVCRRAYIDPAIFAGWRDGSLLRAVQGARGQRQWEQATLRFLKRARRQAAPRARRSRSGPGRKPSMSTPPTQ